MATEDEVESMLSHMNARKLASTGEAVELPAARDDAGQADPVAEPVSAPGPDPDAQLPAGTDLDAAVPVAPEGEPDLAVVPVAADPEPAVEPGPKVAEFIKAKESVYRPPLPPAGIYDAFAIRPPRVRKPVVTDNPADHTTLASVPYDESLILKPDVLPIGTVDVRAAMEEWVKTARPSRRK